MPPLERTARAASNEMLPSLRFWAREERGTKKSEDHIQSESKSKSSIDHSQKGQPKGARGLLRPLPGTSSALLLPVGIFIEV